jgi:hypothetical protein
MYTSVFGHTALETFCSQGEEHSHHEEVREQIHTCWKGAAHCGEEISFWCGGCCERQASVQKEASKWRSVEESCICAEAQSETIAKDEGRLRATTEGSWRATTEGGWRATTEGGWRATTEGSWRATEQSRGDTAVERACHSADPAWRDSSDPAHAAQWSPRGRN